ncbi:Aste57867_10247 [Aphanomyces stellatus]|uniref:Aste57867_10247 protein n=1 Tax=Aphanomyces stellatus TaxID=120398 RepID=A0A485KPV2_9STRA|nr:hypothetical protein As57867_010208 [Aphanomyces stellatus]VFT87122.1 Aste57867_10247 [Aphanomyces stellatus]
MAAASVKEFYARPLLVFGPTWMNTISKMIVLVVGLRGLGVGIGRSSIQRLSSAAPIVRNLMCHGVKSISLHDDECLREEDLSVSVRDLPQQCGQHRRSIVVKERLADMSPNTLLATLSGVLTADLLLNYHAVVFASGSLSREEIVGLTEFCHAQNPPIGVVVTESRGLLGSIFVDFGPAHIAQEDESPEFTVVAMDVVAGTVVVHEKCVAHMIQAGDLIEFAFAHDSGQGNDARLNWLHRVQFSVVDVLGTSSLRVDFRVSPLFTFNLTVHPRLKCKKVRGMRTIAHKSYRENIVAPQIVPCPYYFSAKDAGRGLHLHAILHGMYSYRQEHGFFPQANHALHGNEVVKLTQRFVAQVYFHDVFAMAAFDDVKASLVLELARVAATEFAPLSACIAGLVCRELLKFCGFGCPLSQLLYWDILDVLPLLKDLKKETVFHDPGRIADSHLLSIFGHDALDQLAHARVGVVGCGSVGCEVIQNLAMVGVGTARNTECVAVDSGQVKIQDLSTQSAYRARDVGQPKASAISQRFPSWTGIVAPVHRNHNPCFDPTFWRALDVFVCTVESTYTRFLMDEHSFTYETPLVIASSHGTTGTTRLFAPHATQRWVETELDDADDAASSKLFLLDRVAHVTASIHPPHKTIAHVADPAHMFEINRVVQWARTVFDDIFVQSLSCLRVVWADKIGGRSVRRRDAGFLALAMEAYLRCRALTSIGSCLGVASHLVQRMLEHDKLALDPTNAAHVGLMHVTTVLLARTMDLPVFAGLTLTKCQEHAQDDTIELGELDMDAFVALTAVDMQAVVEPACVVSFDAMDDTNLHVLFVQRLTNVAVVAHDIEPLGFYACKAQCGLRPDSLATAAVVGALATIETLKALLHKSMCLRHADYIGFHGNLVFQSPRPPSTLHSTAMDPTRGVPLRVCPDNITLWRKLVIQCTTVPRLLTVEDIVRYLQTKYEIHVERVVCDHRVLFAAHETAKLKSTFFDLWTALPGAAPIPPTDGFLLLDFNCKDHDGDVVLPPVHLLVPKPTSPIQSPKPS